MVESETPAGSFVANWWTQADGGSVKMNTTVPDITNGSADLMLMIHARSPLGEPHDVAGLAVFLASSDADSVIGLTFFIDGGLT